MNINIEICKGINATVTLMPKKNKTKTEYIIFLAFNLYQKGIRQLHPYTFSTALKVKINEWANGAVKGKSLSANNINERLIDFQNKAKNLLIQLSTKNIKNCSEVLSEIEANAKIEILGKAPKGRQTEIISKLKNYDYETIMKKLFVDRKISIGRQRGYNRSFELLKKYFNNQIPTLNLLSDTDFENFKKWFLENYNVSQNTSTDYLSKIAAVIKFALKLKIITVSPLPERFRGSFVDGNREVLNQNECMALIRLDDGKLSNTELVAKYCLILQLTTGMGYGDMKSLKTSHVKFDENEKEHFIEKSRNKTGVSFKVFLSTNAKHSLNKLIELTAKDGNDINLPTIDYSLRVYKELGKKAHIKTNITTYTLRHTFAVTFMENDGRLEDLQKYLGHLDIKTTQIYGKISNKRLSTKIKELESKSKMHQLQTPLIAV